MPSRQPIVSSIQYKCFGRENRFTKVLDQYDLERISRDNCHRLADWRTLHEAGRGVLIHLADLGLTEEISFPRRGRMQLEFTLMSTSLPDIETSGGFTTEDIIGTSNAPSTHKRRFSVVLLRHNRLLKGDIRSMRFLYLNEQ